LHRVTAGLNHEYGAHLVITGSPQPSLGAMERFVVRVLWRLEAVNADLLTYDIGIMPLVDNPYERRKYSYRLLECGAAGLPVMASPLDVNVRVLSDVGAASPTGPDEWFTVLSALLEASDADRESSGQRLYDLLVKEFAFDAWRTEWIETVLPDAPT
jgi:hypothetical protein